MKKLTQFINVYSAVYLPAFKKTKREFERDCFDLIVKIKLCNEDESDTSQHLQHLSKKTESLKQKFWQSNQQFEENVGKFKQFVLFLKSIVFATPVCSNSNKLFIVLLFFYLISEKCSQTFLVDFARNFLATDLSSFETVLDLDLLRFDLKQFDFKDLDFIFNWILENPVETVNPKQNFIDVILQEKFLKENSLETLQEYTENSKNPNLDLLYESVRNVMTVHSHKKYKTKKSNLPKLNEAVREFIFHFKKDELASSLERYLKMGCCVMNTVFCEQESDYNCPTCSPTIRIVILKDEQVNSQNQPHFFIAPMQNHQCHFK